MSGFNLLATHTKDLLPAGAEPVLGPRFIVWNFVSSREERVRLAQDDWAAQAMGQVPGETEFIPLPPRRA